MKIALIAWLLINATELLTRLASLYKSRYPRSIMIRRETDLKRAFLNAVVIVWITLLLGKP